MPAEPAEPADPNWRDPDVVHETGPPRMPVPGEAPCADASITAPTEDSTEALHTADAEVPDGMLNDSVVVSTTVVAGMEDTEGLSEGVTDVEELIVADSLGEGLIEADAVLESDTDEDNVCDAVNDGDDDTLTLDDALDEGDVE